MTAPPKGGWRAGGPPEEVAGGWGWIEGFPTALWDEVVDQGIHKVLAAEEAGGLGGGFEIGGQIAGGQIVSLYSVGGQCI